MESYTYLLDNQVITTDNPETISEFESDINNLVYCEYHSQLELKKIPLKYKSYKNNEGIIYDNCYLLNNSKYLLFLKKIKNLNIYILNINNEYLEIKKYIKNSYFKQYSSLYTDDKNENNQKILRDIILILYYHINIINDYLEKDEIKNFPNDLKADIETNYDIYSYNENNELINLLTLVNNKMNFIKKILNEIEILNNLINSLEIKVEKNPIFLKNNFLIQNNFSLKIAIDSVME